MFRPSILGMSLWFVVCNGAGAVTVNASFTGSASLFSTSVFGPSGFGLPVTGSFSYVTTGAPSVSSFDCPGDNCSNYEQLIPGGFSATIGSVTVSADNYLVQVKDNFDNLGNIQDNFGIVWRSDLTPALAPLKVNGVDQTVGQFRIDLTAVETLFSNASLPTSLDWSDFSALSPPNLLGTSLTIPTGLFTLSSLTFQQSQTENASFALPEPSTGTLLLAALLFNSLFLRRLISHVVLCDASSKIE